jgi:hypothetical protein
MAITPKNKKAFKIICSLIIVISFFFIARTIVKNYLIHKISKKLQNDYCLNLEIHNTEFKGILGIMLEGIIIKDSTNNKIFNSDTVLLKIRLLPVFIGNLRLSEVLIDELYVDMKSDLLDKAIFHKRTLSLKKDNSVGLNYSKSFNQFLKNFFSFIPDKITFDRLSVNYQRGKMKLSIISPLFILSEGEFKGNFSLSDSLTHSNCKINGKIDRKTKTIEIACSSNDNKPVSIPYLDQRYGLELKFNMLRFNFNYMGYDNNELKFAGFAETSGMSVKHGFIAPHQVITKAGFLDFLFHVGEKYIELDSISKIAINNFSFSPYLKYQHEKEKEIFINIPYFEFSSNKFFESLPEGLFSSIRDIKVSGNLAYSLKSYINLDNPDSTKINSSLENHGFKILQFGAANLTMLNDTFSYQVLENDSPVYTLLVDTNNSDFVRLDDISPFLRYSVLTSEDGSFFYHKGFNEESFQNAIAKNIKEKRFARGGSTITMQLIKNVFLNRNKTISRKLEEMLIVWMIENLHLVSKERMFEIYLNIIEWGPHIYGIQQAAWFYFRKHPSDLTLNESIFLASIIPGPKYFKYAFKEPGKLTEYYSWFYKRLPDVMLQRNQIKPEDTINLRPEVTFEGDAREYLLKPDTIQIDSAFFEQNPLDQSLVGQPEK